MTSKLVALSAAAILFASGALADHCNDVLAEADNAVAFATMAEDNVLDAAEALIEDAIVACDAEEVLMAEAELDSPMLDPDYVSIGQSMLIAAIELVSE